MKSSSPFEYKNQPSTLFSKQERAIQNQFVVAKSLDPKKLHIYQKAKVKEKNERPI
jgi:hypothetical protein